MSQKQPVTLNSPARKFFASQLLSCTLRQDGRIINQGLYSDAVINQVWVQGIVVLVSADGNDLLLDDGTAVIQAAGVTKIVKDLFIHKGMYVMVAGQLKSVASPDEIQLPSIRILKIADLSNNPHSEALWMMEVIDAQTGIRHK